MISQSVLCLLLPVAVNAERLSKPWSLAVGQAQTGCSDLEQAISGDRCQTFADAWVITLDQFKALNPSVDCSKPLIDGQQYCIALDGPTSSSTGSTSPPSEFPPAQSTDPGKTTTPAPTSTGPKRGHVSSMPSTIPECTQWYKISSNDTCEKITASYNISPDDFAKWNPYVDAECDNLWLGYYCCVGIGRGSSSSTSPQTTTSAKPLATTSKPESQAPTTGTVEPPPHQTPVTDKCKNWHKVLSKDSCWKIETDEGISDDDFRSWNGFLNDVCDNMWANYYVCVGI